MDVNEGKGGVTAPAAALSKPASDAPALSPHLAAKLACLALLLAAPVFALATWQVEYTFLISRHFSVSILIAELIVIGMAFLSGADLRSFIDKLEIRAKLALAVFTTTVLVSTAMADADPGMAYLFGLTTLIHMLFLGMLCERFSGAWRNMQQIFLICVAAGGAIYFVLAFGLALSVANEPEFNWKQFSAGVSNVRQIGYYGLATTGIAIGLLANARQQKEVIFAQLLLVLGAWCIFWSGGRAAFLGLLASAFLVALYQRRSGLVSFCGKLATSFSVAALLSLTFTPSAIWGLQSILGRMAGKEDGSEYSSGRLAIWQDTSSWILESPIFGHGQGQFRFTVEAARGIFNHPHNSLLQALFDWGALGLVCLATFAWAIWKQVWRHTPSNRDLALPCIGSMAGLLTMSLLDGALYYPFPIMVVLCACAVLLSLNSRQVKND